MSGLCVENLRVCRGGVEILHGVSLALEAAERVALVGPSGAGKTTLLRALVGLEPHFSGHLTWQGRSLREIGPRQWRRTLVILAQRPAVFPGTVTENVRFAARYHGLEADVPGLLEAVDLAEAAEREAEALSEGERQRLALARALAIRPAMLLLDEPTSALDQVRMERLEALLGQAPVGLLLVSHAPGQAERLTSRQIHLEEGRLR
jgi:tungstate transport system ATP-binding protein